MLIMLPLLGLMSSSEEVEVMHRCKRVVVAVEICSGRREVGGMASPESGVGGSV